MAALRRRGHAERNLVRMLIQRLIVLLDALQLLLATDTRWPRRDDEESKTDPLLTSMAWPE